jgi:hypothetical protein
MVAALAVDQAPMAQELVLAVAVAVLADTPAQVEVLKRTTATTRPTPCRKLFQPEVLALLVVRLQPTSLAAVAGWVFTVKEQVDLPPCRTAEGAEVQEVKTEKA